MVFCPCPARRRGSARACSHALFMGARRRGRRTPRSCSCTLGCCCPAPRSCLLPPEEPLLLPGVRVCERAQVASVCTGRCVCARGHCARTRGAAGRAQGPCACTGAVRTPVRCTRGTFAPSSACVCAQAQGVSTGSLRACALELCSRKRFVHAPGVCTRAGRALAPGARVCTPQPCREQRARRLRQRRALSQLPALLAPPHPATAPGTSRGHGDGGHRRTRRVQDHTAHLGPGFSIFPSFPKSPPHKPYEGLFYPAGAHGRLCFPRLSPSPCPNPAPGGSAPLLPHHRGVFGAGGRVPGAPPRVTAALRAGSRCQGWLTLRWARRSHPSSSIKPSFKKHFAKCPADTGGTGRWMPPAARRARCQRVASKGHGGHAGPPRPLPAGDGMRDGLRDALQPPRGAGHGAAPGS